MPVISPDFIQTGAAIKYRFNKIPNRIAKNAYIKISSISISAAVQKGKPDTIFKDVYQAIKNVFEESN